MSERLTKEERLRGEKRISALFAHGRRGSVGCLRFVWVARQTGVSVGVSTTPSKGDTSPAASGGFGLTISSGTRSAVSVLFSVPKKIYKRAWKRNLLKRRMRESYRRRKSALVERASEKELILDIALICVGPEKGGPTKGVTPEIPDFKTLDNAIERILEKIVERI